MTVRNPAHSITRRRIVAAAAVLAVTLTSCQGAPASAPSAPVSAPAEPKPQESASSWAWQPLEDAAARSGDADGNKTVLSARSASSRACSRLSVSPTTPASRVSPARLRAVAQ